MARMESIGAMMEFTTILESEPNKAYDWICSNYYRLDIEELKEIIKELLYSLHYHVDNSFYGTLYREILDDVQIELDETYDEDYEEYSKWKESWD